MLNHYIGHLKNKILCVNSTSINKELLQLNNKTIEIVKVSE